MNSKADLLKAIENQLVLDLNDAKGHGDADAVTTLEHQLLVIRFLPKREFAADEPIAPGSCVRLSLNGVESLCLIVPSGGGFVTRLENEVIQVLTPSSPLGEALLGRRAGDLVELSMRNGSSRTYQVTASR